MADIFRGAVQSAPIGTRSVALGAIQLGPEEVAIAISNRANTAVTDNGDGSYTIEKVSGAADYDASAVSAEGTAGDFVLQIEHITYNGSNYVAGMTSDPLVSDYFDSIDRMWAHIIDGARNIFENGVSVFSSGTNGYTWIWRIGDQLSYGRGATLADAKASPDRTVTDANTLYFDSSLVAVGAKMRVKLTRPAS